MGKKSFLNNPSSWSLWWNPAISQPWAPEPPEGLGLRPVFYNRLGALRRRGRDSEREWQKETEGEKEISQRCGDCNRDSQGLLEKKYHNSQRHKNWLNTGVFIELRYTADRTHKWFTPTEKYGYIYPHICVCMALMHLYLAFAQETLFMNKSAFKTSGSYRSTQEAILIILKQ